MKKYKVCVYAIAKQEEKFVNRWVASMKEADEIYVLDTGSTDNTVKLLEENGVHVTQKEIKPWRFDVARNMSLDLVCDDADICVCTDLDEVFTPGWRKALEANWNEKTTRARYDYNWSFDEFQNPAVNFYIEKIHKRHGYVWTHPVHEVLTYTLGVENRITIDDITLNHYPDQNKSRSSYLPLLELSVKEKPEDDRNVHYLGREYMYYGKWNECIDTLIKHLKLKSATWLDERCASMRFIARAYQALNRYDEAEMWLNKAILEAPYLREPYVEMAILNYRQKDFKSVIKYINEALKIEKNPKSYINEPFCYDFTIYDLLSIAYFNENDINNALKYCNIAIEMKPNDERLLKNREIINEAKNKKAD